MRDCLQRSSELSDRSTAESAAIRSRLRRMVNPVLLRDRSADRLADGVSETSFAQVEARQTVARLLPTLAERTRRIVELRFFQELSQSEIAELVGVSQLHVSRLLRQALEQMAVVMEDGADVSESAAS